MNKAYITGILFHNAIDYVNAAHKAHEDGSVDAEARYGISAYLMCALALEGIINEVGETICPRVWGSIESIDTVSKWLFVSDFLENGSFERGKEPIQTVTDLKERRNKLVHPKKWDLGDEVIVRDKDGCVRRDVVPEYVLANDDTVFVGWGKLLVEYNASSAQKAAIRTNFAFQELKKLVPGETIQWVTGLKSHCDWLNET